jgi:hypothetical protein
MRQRGKHTDNREPRNRLRMLFRHQINKSCSTGAVVFVVRDFETVFSR